MDRSFGFVWISLLFAWILVPLHIGGREGTPSLPGILCWRGSEGFDDEKYRNNLTKGLKKLRSQVSYNGCLNYICGIFSPNGIDIAIKCPVEHRKVTIRKNIKTGMQSCPLSCFCFNACLVLAGSMQEKCPISLVVCCHHRKELGFNLLQ